MKYCGECGTELIYKQLDKEGDIPYCESCQAYRFPQYNLAMSAIVYDEDEQSILLIQQYGNPNYILIAGYVNQGEAIEGAVRREVKEETNLEVIDCHFNASRFYEKNNVLMVNFACRVKRKADLICNEEIDKANWFSIEEAAEVIYPNSLAQQFLIKWLEKDQSLKL